MRKSSESEKEDAVESEPAHPPAMEEEEDGGGRGGGGATRDEDRVTASLRILSASFQWAPSMYLAITRRRSELTCWALADTLKST